MTSPRRFNALKRRAIQVPSPFGAFRNSIRIQAATDRNYTPSTRENIFGLVRPSRSRYDVEQPADNNRRFNNIQHRSTKMKQVHHRLLILVPAFFLAVILTGCETTEGMGRDVQSAGEALEDTADDAQN